MTALDNQPELPLDIAKTQKRRDEWAKKIKEYEQHFDKWMKSGDKIVRRYRDERDANETSRIKKINLFWANTQTLGPATYSKLPSPEVDRRYFDRDPIGRTASAILERSLSYEMDICKLHSQILLCRDDYLIVGRGTLWQRYEPIIEKAAQDSDGDDDDTGVKPGDAFNTAQSGVEAIGANGGPPLEDKVIGENAPQDYVHWKDFLHGIGQNWGQVPWVGRKILVDKATVKARWPNQPDLLQKLSFTHRQEKDDADNKGKVTSGIGNLALIYELWDKTTFTALWFSPDVKDRLIEEIDDPLMLTDFFPCPEPLYATMTTDRLIPRPDFTLVEDQYNECDNLTARIALLVKSLAVRGTYDASNTKLADLLNERPENFMLPVDNWAAFAEKGGLKGQMSFVPIDQIVTVLQGLQAARQVSKNDIDEVTGISDIVRGQGVASETATAQQIKSQFANLRLNSRRDDMARFINDSLRIKAEVICEHFDPKTLRQISGFDQMTEVTELMKREQAAGRDPQAAVEDLWNKSYEMLKNDPLRLTHIKVNIDTMVEADRQAEQQSRVQFLQAVGGFIQEAMQAIQTAPQIAPLLGQMLAFGVRGFKIGRELEATIDAAIDQLTAAAANPQPQPPSPEQVKAEAEAAAMKQSAENEKTKLDIEKQKVELAAQQTKMEFLMNLKLQVLELQLKYGSPATEAAALMTQSIEQEMTNGA